MRLYAVMQTIPRNFVEEVPQGLNFSMDLGLDSELCYLSGRKRSFTPAASSLCSRTLHRTGHFPTQASARSWREGDLDQGLSFEVLRFRVLMVL